MRSIPSSMAMSPHMVIICEGARGAHAVRVVLPKRCVSLVLELVLREVTHPLLHGAPGALSDGVLRKVCDRARDKGASVSECRGLTMAALGTQVC